MYEGGGRLGEESGCIVNGYVCCFSKLIYVFKLYLFINIFSFDSVIFNFFFYFDPYINC